jgi:hypothetical protein
MCSGVIAVSPARGAVCPALHTNVQVLEKITPPEIDASRTEAEIARLRQGDPVAANAAVPPLSGLTIAALAVDQHIVTIASDVDDDTVCVSPSVISVELQASPRIFVDAGADSCRREAATAHELGHAAIDRRLIQVYAPIFERRIRAMADAIGSVPVPDSQDPAETRARIAAKINAIIAVTYDDLTADRLAAQRDYDSPDSDRRLGAACAAAPSVPDTPRAGSR